jgi:outer membrane protein TolC
VDVFNRLGSAALARQSEQAARLEDLQAIRLSLSAEVADAYFDAVEQRNQLALLKQQIKIDRDLLELTELRFECWTDGVGGCAAAKQSIGRNREPGAPQ